MKCLAGQRDIAAKIGTVPPDSGRLTGMLMGMRSREEEGKGGMFQRAVEVSYICLYRHNVNMHVHACSLPADFCAYDCSGHKFLLNITLLVCFLL